MSYARTFCKEQVVSLLICEKYIVFFSICTDFLLIKIIIRAWTRIYIEIIFVFISTFSRVNKLNLKSSRIQMDCFYTCLLQYHIESLESDFLSLGALQICSTMLLMCNKTRPKMHDFKGQLISDAVVFLMQPLALLVFA